MCICAYNIIFIKQIGKSLYVLYGYLYITLKVSAYKSLKLVHICNCTPSTHYIARLPNKMFVRLKYISNVSPFSPSKVITFEKLFVYIHQYTTLNKPISSETNPKCACMCVYIFICTYTRPLPIRFLDEGLDFLYQDQCVKSQYVCVNRYSLRRMCMYRCVRLYVHGNQPCFCLGKQSHEPDILAYNFSPATQYTCLVQIVCASKQTNLNKN